LQALDSAQALVRRQDGIITFWSRGMERLYGYCAAAALGRNAHHLLKTEFPSLLERIEAELKERGEWTGELLQLRHDGETVIVASHWSLWRGNGQIAVYRSLQ
jgi:PAS domain S-box-containing protein